MEQPTFPGTTDIYILTNEQLHEIVRLTVAQIISASKNNQLRSAPTNYQPLVLMSTSEVTQQYNVSYYTLWRWARAGLIHPVRIGRENKYNRREIESMFAK